MIRQESTTPKVETSDVDTSKLSPHPPTEGDIEDQVDSLEELSTGLVLDVDIGQYLPDNAQPAWGIAQQFPLLLSLLLITIGYGLGKILQLGVAKILTKVTMKTKSDFDDKLARYLSAPLVVTSVVLALIVVVLVLNIPPMVSEVLVRVLVTMLLLFWGRAWFRATHLALEKLSSSRKIEIFQPRTVPLFEMGIKILLFGLLTYFFFGIWGIDATAWVASAGIIGIAVGFGARDTLANLISGVSIVADAPYKLGDFIVLDTGERGLVTRLGMRSTRLLTRDDVEISIPNAVIGNAKITNESGGPWIKQRIRVPVGVAYGSDTARVVEILEGVAANNDYMVLNPAPRVRMRAFGESSLDFELMGWIDLPEQRGLVKHQLMMEIDRIFREEDIQIPFPQRDVHVRSGQPANENPRDE